MPLTPSILPQVLQSSPNFRSIMPWYVALKHGFGCASVLATLVKVSSPEEVSILLESI